MTAISSRINFNLKVTNLDQKKRFSTFPLEIQQRIISFCDVRTIYLLMQTCKHFSKFCKENQIWKLILKNVGALDGEYDYFDCCRIANSYRKNQESNFDYFFLPSRKTLIFNSGEITILPFLICDQNIIDIKSHEILFVGEKIFVGLKNNLLMIYEFDSYSMTLLSSIPLYLGITLLVWRIYE